jgi:hypothetical protein
VVAGGVGADSDGGLRWRGDRVIIGGVTLAAIDVKGGRRPQAVAGW